MYKLSLVVLLVAASSALPQYYPYPGVYPGYYQSFYPMQVYPGYPAVYPGAADPAATRNLFTLSSFQTGQGTLATNTAFPNLVLTGTVLFQQNPIGGTTTEYQVYLNGPNIANRKYQLALATACTGTGQVLVGSAITSPLLLINGFYIFGTTNTFNIDATNGATSVLGKRLLVLDQTTAQPGTIVGCTSGGLA